MPKLLHKCYNMAILTEAAGYNRLEISLCVQGKDEEEEEGEE